jgi:hypothetical protein
MTKIVVSLRSVFTIEIFLDIKHAVMAYAIKFGVQDIFLALEIRNLVRSNSVS